MKEKIGWHRIQRGFYPARILIISFVSIILLGTALLMLPQSTRGVPLSLIDALFTSTSATCVTGLIVTDTGARFTLFGQLVILLLIQIGGLGIMTFSTFFMYLMGGRFSIRGRDIVQETLSGRPMKDLASLLRSVFVVTILIELIGAVLLALRFLKIYPLGKALYFGFFHSVSAFCNAGFCLFSNSFIDSKGDLLINGVITLLIILGGIGFIVLFDLRKIWAKGSWNFSGLSFHSKIALAMSFFLLFTGMAVFFLLEYQNALRYLNLPTKLISSFFQSVTPRTAGFNTLDIACLTNSTLLFLILLMFIGASPGSCGGGIKTTTFGVLIALFFTRFRNQEEVNLFQRRVPKEILSKAISIAFFSLMVIIGFTLILLITESGSVPNQQSRGLFIEALFEVISAFGTVGLSTGITVKLSALGRVLITMVMFIGRLSPLTVALAVGGESTPKFKYPQERFLVG